MKRSRTLRTAFSRTVFAFSAFGTLCAVVALTPDIYAAQFKRAPRDPQATYAIHATRSQTEPGKWNMRETIKLCAAAPGSTDDHGTEIKYFAVSPSLPCPEAPPQHPQRQ